jgi:hypothetical protein
MIGMGNGKPDALDLDAPMVIRNIWNEQADKDAVIWRYFRPDRFVDVVTTRSLYFAAATQFEDRFEGAVRVFARSRPDEPDQPSTTFVDRAFAELRRLTKISCWHRAPHESDAMWRLYADSHKGVALKTTVGKLHAALLPFRLAPTFGTEDPWCGDVRYFDLSRNHANLSMLERFFYKHQPFEWEREHRIAISLRMAEEFAVAVPKHGISVGIKLDALVDSIMIGPGIRASDFDAVVAAAEESGLSGRVSMSTLLGTPS